MLVLGPLCCLAAQITNESLKMQALQSCTAGHTAPPSSSPAAAPHLPVKRVRSLNKQVLWRLDALGATPQKVCWDPSAVTVTLQRGVSLCAVFA